MASDDAVGTPAWVKRAGLAAGIVVAAVIEILATGLPPGARHAAATAALMACWWFSEALPIHVTALVPLVAFPWIGVFKGGPGPGVRETALQYVDAYIFLFMGGMALAAAMERSGLHRRIALRIMKAVGTEPRRLLLGVLLATGFISMWISNTATAVMMMPIGMSVLAQFEAQTGRRPALFGASLMLAVAYGANVGGIGTKIGTAPNAQFSGFVEKELGLEISFARFLLIGVPFVVAFLPVVWGVLWWTGRRDAPSGGSTHVDRELAALGPMSRAEKTVLAFFLAAAALWMVSSPLLGVLKPHLPWLQSKHLEAAIGMFFGFSLLAVPVGGGARALTVAALRRVPWSTLLLLGGGFAMAHGIQESGLSSWAGAQLAGLRQLPQAVQFLLAAILCVGLSAVASNTATIAVMLTVLRESVAPGDVVPVLAVATIASSCDFMLPAGTPPNAIVFGSGYVSVPRMVRTGGVLDLAAALLAGAWGLVGLRALLPAL